MVKTDFEWLGSVARITRDPMAALSRKFQSYRQVLELFGDSRSSTNHSSSFKMPSTFKKDKPWDTDDIDKWKVGSIILGFSFNTDQP